MSDGTHIPLRAQRCVTHHICECLHWKMQQMEKTLRAVREIAENNRYADPMFGRISELIDDVLKEEK